MEEIDLGEKLAQYRQRIPLTWWAILFVAFLGLVVSLWLLDQRVYSEVVAHGFSSADRVFQQQILWVIAFGIIVLISGIGLITYPRIKLRIYQYGFEFQTKTAFKHLWDQVASVSINYAKVWWLFFPIHKKQIILSMSNGETITLDERLYQLDGARKLIEDQVFPLLQDKLRGKYCNGEILSFNGLLLSRTNGMKTKNKVIRWDHVRDVKVENGKVNIDFYLDGGKQEKLAINVREISNLPILTLLIQEKLSQPVD